MNKSRLEAFSDGVVAILITIMVLDLHVPGGVTLSALHAVLPTLLSYVLSFVFLGIYWNNHHHMLQATRHISGPVLWANLHLLFWLSLVPFVTAWMGRSGDAPVPTATYGVVLLLAAVAFTLLQNCIIAVDGQESLLARAVRADIKGKISLGAYIVAIPLTFASVWIARAIFVAVALLWLVPDRRIEAIVTEPGH
jgi:uncharacterized membrane protein